MASDEQKIIISLEDIPATVPNSEFSKRYSQYPEKPSQADYNKMLIELCEARQEMLKDFLKIKMKEDTVQLQIEDIRKKFLKTISKHEKLIEQQKKLVHELDMLCSDEYNDIS